MYTSGLSYSRYRPAYYDEGERYSTHSHSSRAVPDYSWLGSSSYRPTTSAYQSSGTRKLPDETSMASSKSGTSDSGTRRQRYTRSSTHSVAQLLSDSCSSLLQKITTKVRGPSATVERQLQNSSSSSNISTNSHNRHPIPLSTSKSSTVVPNFGSSRSRVEDKYTSVLDRIYGRKRETERKREPSVGRLSKSNTTVNVLQLSEKAYPYVNSSTSVVQREKTPYRSEQRKNIVYPEPSYAYLDRDSVYRVRHRSNHSELRPRRSSKPQRVGKSEYNERKPSLTTTNLKLCAVEIPILNDHSDTETPKPKHVDLLKEVETPKVKDVENVSLVPPAALSTKALSDDSDATPTPAVPDPVSEREAKRKEIQSLIMKYSALDEAYNKSSVVAAPTGTTSVAAAIAQKYYPETTKMAAVSTTGQPSSKKCMIERGHLPH